MNNEFNNRNNINELNNEFLREENKIDEGNSANINDNNKGTNSNIPVIIMFIVLILFVFVFLGNEGNLLSSGNKHEQNNNNFVGNGNDKEQNSNNDDELDENESNKNDNNEVEEDNNHEEELEQEEILTFPIGKEEYRMQGNSLEEFDMYFLKLDNTKRNKLYSPLSIKNALGMLKEGAEGESKEQISNIIGNYSPKKYINNENMAFANTLFIRDTYKDSVKQSYNDAIYQKYYAQVNYDSFSSPNNINNWVKDNTLGLINNMFDDVSRNNIMLINALGIDMEWKESFIECPCRNTGVNYQHMDFWWSDGGNVHPYEFNNKKEKISALDITASFNNYDIVNTLGEQNIRDMVRNEFKKYLTEHPEEKVEDYLYDENIDGLSEGELIDKYLDRYIREIDSNYKNVTKITDYRFFVDDNIKAFAKELKEYNGVTLEYVAIMPKEENLNTYINKVSVSDINSIISNLKELKLESFKDGVVTKIEGYIPKFKFDYDLNLNNSLNKIGITNIFNETKANLTNISDDSSLFINEIKHKTTIEFTQDGIKAAAATGGGAGAAAGGFDYKYDVPVEIIDLTFDKPYMFLIRDKNSGEIWFNGTVYDPLKFSEDKSGCLTRW